MQHFIGSGTALRIYSRISTRDLFHFLITVVHVLTTSRESRKQKLEKMAHRAKHSRRFDGGGYFEKNLRREYENVGSHGSRLWTTEQAEDGHCGGSCHYQGLRFRPLMTQGFCI